jgi:hypothetical protein
MSRRHPWRAEHPDAVIVARPSKWGNPFIVGTPENGGNITREEAVRSFRRALLEGRLQFGKRQVMANLRGKDLACWCDLSEPCHADVLLELANRETP